MKLLGGCFAVATGVLALAGAAAAQENLDAGKSPAQLYASDCAICHKSPQGLAAKGGVLGLESFLREHYTASKELAAAIAGYLRSVGGGPAAPAAGRTGSKRAPKGDAKGDEKPKSGDPKSGDAEKPTEKSGEKPADQKPAGGKSSEPKSSEPKSSEPKSSEPKSDDAKSGGGKSGGGKSGAASTPKPTGAKPEGGKSD